MSSDSPCGSSATLLARRLDGTREERWLETALASALGRMIPASTDLTGCDVEYCKIEHDSDVDFVTRVHVGDGAEPRRLSCTLFATPEASRREYDAEQRHQLSESTRLRLAREGVQCPVCLLAESAMIVRAFPVDPVLQGLAPATDFHELAPVFAAHLEPCRREGLVPRGLRWEILHYKPRRSCTLRYMVELGHATGAGGCEQLVFGKVARDERGRRKLVALEAAWSASLAGGGEWRAARPLAYVPHWRLLLQEAVPGRDFRVVLGELTVPSLSKNRPPAESQQDASWQGAATTRVSGETLGGAATAPRRVLLSSQAAGDSCSGSQGAEPLRVAARHLERITRALRSLQAAPLFPGQLRTFEILLAKEERNLRHFGDAQPGLRCELAALLAELAGLGPEIRANRPVFSHGDFAPGNVLVDGERVGLIDFDKAACAEPASDVACFLAHLCSIGNRHPERRAGVTALARHMRDFYLALAPEVSARRLALHEGLHLASHVLRSYPKQQGGAEWLGWARGEMVAAWNRVAAAAGCDDAGM